MNTAATFRIEHYSLGDIEVPAEAYWGIHSRRAVKNFTISGVLVGSYPAFVRALVAAKAAAAIGKFELGVIAEAKSKAILAACKALKD